MANRTLILFSLLSITVLSGQIVVASPQTKPVLSLDSLLKPNFNPLVSSPINYTISGPVDDSIDYIELYLTADHQCKTTCQGSSCNPLAYTETITAGTAIPYAAGGTHRSVSNASILAFLKADPETLGSNTYYIGMYVISTGKHCSSTYCSTSSDFTESPLCIQANYTSSSGGSVIVTQQDNGNVRLNNPTQYLYAANNSNATIQRCLLNPDGTISNCLTNPTLDHAPLGIAFATVNGKQYAYVTVGSAWPGEEPGSYNNMYKCDLSAAGTGAPGGTGNLTCTAMAPTGFGISDQWVSPSAITFATVDSTQYAYVVDNDASRKSVYRCTLWSTSDALNGNFQQCNTAVNLAGIPHNIVFATISGTQYAYVTDPVGGHVNLCTLNPNDPGIFSTCTPTGAPNTSPGLWITPAGIAIATAGNGHSYAYVSDNSANGVFQCLINNDGTLSLACTKVTTSENWNPSAMNVATINGKQSLYLSDSSTVYQCPINNDGSLPNTCPSMPIGGSISGNAALPIIMQ